MTGHPGSRSPRHGKLATDERRIVGDIGESHKAFGMWPARPATVPVDLAARAAERAYRRGVVQGAQYMLWHLVPDSRKPGGERPAFLARLTGWRQRGVTQEHAQAELPPSWDSTVPDRRRLSVTRASDIKPASGITQRPEWGPWDIDRGTCVLWTTAPGYRYEVSLDDCTNSARVLDWICQVADKEWQDRDRIIAGLVIALADVLEPQSRLCPSGQSRQLSRAVIRARAGGSCGLPAERDAL